MKLLPAYLVLATALFTQYVPAQTLTPEAALARVVQQSPAQASNPFFQSLQRLRI